VSRVRRIAIVALVAAIAAAGCRGENRRLSTIEFMRQTQAICLKANRVAGGTYTINKRTAALFRGRLERGRREADRIRRLRPPAGLDRDLKDFVDATDEAVEVDIELFGTWPQPKAGSRRWRELQHRLAVAARQLERAATQLPVGLACRSSRR
jgi:hypothetical protein